MILGEIMNYADSEQYVADLEKLNDVSLIPGLMSYNCDILRRVVDVEKNFYTCVPSGVKDDRIRFLAAKLSYVKKSIVKTIDDVIIDNGITEDIAKESRLYFRILGEAPGEYGRKSRSTYRKITNALHRPLINVLKYSAVGVVSFATGVAMYAYSNEYVLQAYEYVAKLLE